MDSKLAVEDATDVENAVNHDKPKKRNVKGFIKHTAFALLVILALEIVALKYQSPLRGNLPEKGKNWINSHTQCEGQHQDQCAFITEEEGRRILAHQPIVIDGHNDMPFKIRMLYGNQIYGPDFDFWHQPWHVDGTRLKNSNILGTFWSAFVPCPEGKVDEHGVKFGDGLYAEAVQQTFQQVDIVKRLVEQNDGLLKLATSSRDVVSPGNMDPTDCWFGKSDSDVDQCILRALSTPRNDNDDNKNRIASMIGVEGTHQIGNSIANLRSLYQLGVRYLTLTHTCDTKYADSANSKDPTWGGLSEDGRKLVKEMNRLGMLVDLSHVSADVMRQVLTGETTRAPVMFSHSSAFALCAHERNVPDDVLHLVKKNNGIVMVNFYNAFVLCGDENNDPPHATLNTVADHIEYIGKLIGWEHVGIGSDYDGVPSLPIGLEDVTKFPNLIAELLNRGVKAADVLKVGGLNILRVWRSAERVAEEMRKEGALPLEDDIPKYKPAG